MLSLKTLFYSEKGYKTIYLRVLIAQSSLAIGKHSFIQARINAFIETLNRPNQNSIECVYESDTEACNGCHFTAPCLGRHSCFPSTLCLLHFVSHLLSSAYCLLVTSIHHGTVSTFALYRCHFQLSSYVFILFRSI